MRKWNAIQPVVTELNHVAMRQKILQRAHEAQEAGTVRTTLSKEELALVPFWQQGDVSLETSEALEARCRLRKAPAVVEELQRWWSTAQRSVQSGVDAAASTVAREDYIRISRLLSKAMLPDFDADEAQRAAEEDWEDDSAGSPSLSRERFMDCIFELADVWTEHISEGEYVRFLSGLFERIAYPGQWTPSGSTWFWRHEKDVDYTDDPEPLPEATDEGSEVRRTRIEEQKTEGQTEEQKTEGQTEEQGPAGVQRRIERPKSFRRMIPPKISVPEVTVPEISVPKISVPKISVPEISVRKPELLSLSRDDDAKCLSAPSPEPVAPRAPAPTETVRPWTAPWSAGTPSQPSWYAGAPSPRDWTSREREGLRSAPAGLSGGTSPKPRPAELPTSDELPTSHMPSIYLPPDRRALIAAGLRVQRADLELAKKMTKRNLHPKLEDSSGVRALDGLAGCVAGCVAGCGLGHSGVRALDELAGCVLGAVVGAELCVTSVWNLSLPTPDEELRACPPSHRGGHSGLRGERPASPTRPVLVHRSPSTPELARTRLIFEASWPSPAALDEPPLLALARCPIGVQPHVARHGARTPPRGTYAHREQLLPRVPWEADASLSLAMAREGGALKGGAGSPSRSRLSLHQGGWTPSAVTGCMRGGGTRAGSALVLPRTAPRRPATAPHDATSTRRHSTGLAARATQAHGARPYVRAPRNGLWHFQT
jgi:hypothetical protein